MQMASLQQLDPELSEASVNKGGGVSQIQALCSKTCFSASVAYS